MTPERWQELKPILAAALELAPEERRDYIDRSCAELSLREEVLSLIAAHEELQTTVQAPPPRIHQMLDDGVQLGSYTILGRLGAGGMGEVYEAVDSKLGRKVAIKVLAQTAVYGPAQLSRFKREARTLASLNHPGICTVFDEGEHEGQQFIVMELLDGKTLKERMNGKPLGIREILELGTQISDGLDFAHSHGIVHRDVKPTNVFVTDRGYAKILDFGLAKQLSPTAKGTRIAADSEPDDESRDLTAPGTAVGTVAYMSPEQALGEELDARSDLFSFGVLLYEMSTGRQPFSGATSAAIFNAILHGAPTSPVRLNPDVLPEFERIVNKALEKDRTLRYQHASEMRADLKRLQRDSSSAHSTFYRTPLQPARSAKGIRWLVAASTLALAIATAAGAYFYFHRAPLLTDKDSIVLADFTNTTGDPVFDGTLRQGLSVALDQSPFLDIVSDDEIAATLRLMEKTPDTRLTHDVSRELCQRANARATIEGSIAALGDQYVLGLNAVRCDSGKTIVEEQVTAPSKEKVLYALSNAASQLRSKLGESRASLSSYDAPLEQVTTSSLEALQVYTEARKSVAKAEPLNAIALLEKAVTLDPNFAFAYATLGAQYSNIGETAPAKKNIQRAYDLRDRASERERFSISAGYYGQVEEDFDKSAQVRELAEKIYPNRPGYNDLAGQYEALGRYDEAIAAFNTANRMSPDTPLILYNLARAYLREGRVDEATAIIQQIEAHHPDSPVSVLLYWVAFLRNDTVGMTRQAQIGEANPKAPFAMLGQEAATDEFAGQLSSAHDLVKRAVASAKQLGSTEIGVDFQMRLAMSEALSGEFSEARTTIAESENPDVDSINEGGAAITWALLGSKAQAQTLAADLNKKFPDGTYVQFVYLPAVRAIQAINEGNEQAAIDELNATSSHELLPVYGLIRLYVLGEAYLAAHESTQAATAFQKIIDRPGADFYSRTGPLARLGLARAYAQEGDTVRARGAYQDFFAIWKDADPDVPILKQAKTEYAKLP